MTDTMPPDVAPAPAAARPTLGRELDGNVAILTMAYNEKLVQYLDVAGQANPGGRKARAVAHRINTMQQPVLGNVAIDKRVGSDAGKSKNE